MKVTESFSHPIRLSHCRIIRPGIQLLLRWLGWCSSIPLKKALVHGPSYTINRRAPTTPH